MTNNQQTNNSPSPRVKACYSFLLVTFSSVILNLALSSHLRSALLNKYPDDSFYTLSTFEAIGLAVITTTLLLLILTTTWFITNIWIKRCEGYSAFFKTIFALLNMFFVMAIYQLILVISPQVFYTYYQVIFLDLPVQWVIKPISVDKLLERFSFRLDGSIADHLASLALWVLLSNTAIQWLSHTAFNRHTISNS